MSLVLFTPVRGRAQDIRFEANVDNDVVELGSTFQLTLTITGTQDISPIQIPDIDGLETRYLGPSTQVFISNGNTSTAISFMYTVYPTRVGKFQIPSILLEKDGRTYSTLPIDVNIVDRGTVPTSRRLNNAQVRLQDKIFIIMAVPKKELYLYEKVPLILRLFVKDISVKDFQYPEFEHIGFKIDDFNKPSHYEKVIKGIKYDIVDFSTFISPTRTGELSLGPARLVANILFKKSRGAGRSGSLRSIFDDDFFDGFFNSYDVQPFTLEAEKITFNVLPLPSEGKPDHFSGGVGQYDLEVTASPSVVNAGDPVTIRMRIKGAGNFSSVKMPELPSNKNLKFYDQQITEEENTKIIEQVVIPLNEYVKEIPPIEFSYFDSNERKYVTLKKGPFPIEVNKKEGSEELKVVGLDPRKSIIYDREEILGKDISFIKDHPGRWQKKGYMIYKSTQFIAIVILFIILWLGTFSVICFRKKMKTDVKFAQRLKAPHQAKRGLKGAKVFLNNGKYSEFYESLFKTIQSYFGNRFHVPPGVITAQYVKDEALKTKRGNEVSGIIESVFTECEMVRYASITAEAHKMNETLRNAEIIIDFFERNA